MAKICADCRHHAETEGKHKCMAIIDLVTGEQQDIECKEARAAEWYCGHDAKLFKEADGVQEKRIARERETRKSDAPEVKEAKAAVARVRDMRPGKSDG